MIDIHSTQDFLNALSQAGDKLVIVEFYATWCASCRALFPKVVIYIYKSLFLNDQQKHFFAISWLSFSFSFIHFDQLCRTAEEHPEITFLKVNFDENKPMCKNLNVKVLPYFHFYRGADGQLDSFSCSLAKVSIFFFW